MERNTIIGFLLIGAILIGYSILTQPDAEEIAAAKMRQDSIQRVEEEKNRQKAETSKEEKEVADTIRTQARQEIKDKPTDLSSLQKRYGTFAEAAEGEDELLTLENNLLSVQISNQGGRIYSVELKEYKRYDDSPLILFSGDTNSFGFRMFADNKDIYTNELYFEPQTTEKTIVAEKDSQQVRLRLYANPESYIEYVYTIYPDEYMLDFDVNFINMDRVIASNYNKLDLDWTTHIEQLERDKKNENNYTTIYYKYHKDDVDKMKSRTTNSQSEELANKVKWVAFKHQFFSSVLIAEESFDYGEISFDVFEDESSSYLKKCVADLNISYNGGANVQYPFKYYFGPNHFKTLKDHGMELQELVTVGGSFLRWINRFIIIPIFNWLGNFISNYGIIILLLTVIIKIALLPLTYRSFKSQAKMKVLKPQVDEIAKKYPKGKEMEKQQATMNLYKKAGASPMGGCLPLLLQMPILLAMYRFFPTSIELRQESFLWANDLSTYDAFISWEANIPLISGILQNHISLFTVLMAFTTFLSMRFSGSATAGPTSPNMPNMKMMQYFMPVMLLFVLNNFSAGLTYYLFLANVITLGQNYLFKFFIDDEALLKKLEANKKKPQKRSKFQERMEEMAKQRGQQKQLSGKKKKK